MCRSKRTQIEFRDFRDDSLRGAPYLYILYIDLGNGENVRVWTHCCRRERQQASSTFRIKGCHPQACLSISVENEDCGLTTQIGVREKEDGGTLRKAPTSK
ncbi:hypothetical protein JTB14_012720 [Gonioctena quinquepunctata]|nr:hypothetical protein JTB14_012720 [Gonioctena quinquepunctata]